MDKAPQLHDVVAVKAADGTTLKAMISAVESPGLVGSRVKISPVASSLSARASQLVGQWLPHSPVPAVGCWSWPN